MSKDRELMRQAVEALEYADACLKKQLTTKTKHEYAQDLLMTAGTALRERLAQPEQTVSMDEYKRLQDLVTSQGIRLMEYESELEPDAPHWNSYKQGWEDGVVQERQRIVNLLMIQHEMAKGAHNYWHVAAQLIQADVASDT